jgi:hypothetical protein
MTSPTRDAGLLPQWGTAELPTPPPFTFRNVLRTVGPGIIGLGIALGSGEWLLGPSIIVAYGPAFMWITTISVLLQTLLNLEMSRYTLYTGEPIITGFMRTRPGPTVWGWVYVVLAFLQYGWPGWALASATATAAIFLGHVPTAADAGLVKVLGYLTFAVCFAIALSSKKVEKTIESVMWVLVSGKMLFLLGIVVLTVSAENWVRVGTGFVSFGQLPAGADWLLVGAFAAYSGLGGIGNAFVTNWVRDKGQGMGATVGYIPGARGEKLTLRSHGNVFAVTPTAMGRWRTWWKYANVDQWMIFQIGSIAGMALTALLTLQYVPSGTRMDGWAVASVQADAIRVVHGNVLYYITLVCGFVFLFSTQLGIVDGLPRATTDVLWTGSPAVRRWRGGDVRAVYATILAIFAVWGSIALNLAQPRTLIVISANVAGFIGVFLSIHTIVVNRKFLPLELRPPLWRELALVATALFYGFFVIAAISRIISTM